MKKTFVCILCGLLLSCGMLAGCVSEGDISALQGGLEEVSNATVIAGDRAENAKDEADKAGQIANDANEKADALLTELPGKIAALFADQWENGETRQLAEALIAQELADYLKTSDKQALIEEAVKKTMEDIENRDYASESDISQALQQYLTEAQIEESMETIRSALKKIEDAGYLTDADVLTKDEVELQIKSVVEGYHYSTLNADEVKTMISTAVVALSEQIDQKLADKLSAADYAAVTEALPAVIEEAYAAYALATGSEHLSAENRDVVWAALGWQEGAAIPVTPFSAQPLYLTLIRLTTTKDLQPYAVIFAPGSFTQMETAERLALAVNQKIAEYEKNAGGESGVVKVQLSDRDTYFSEIEQMLALFSDTYADLLVGFSTPDDAYADYGVTKIASYRSYVAECDALHEAKEKLEKGAAADAGSIEGAIAAYEKAAEREGGFLVLTADKADYFDAINAAIAVWHSTYDGEQLDRIEESMTPDEKLAAYGAARIAAFRTYEQAQREAAIADRYREVNAALSAFVAANRDIEDIEISEDFAEQYDALEDEIEAYNAMRGTSGLAIEETPDYATFLTLFEKREKVSYAQLLASYRDMIQDDAQKRMQGATAELRASLESIQNAAVERVKAIPYQSGDTDLKEARDACRLIWSDYQKDADEAEKCASFAAWRETTAPALLDTYCQNLMLRMEQDVVFGAASYADSRNAFYAEIAQDLQTLKESLRTYTVDTGVAYPYTAAYVACEEMIRTAQETIDGEAEIAIFRAHCAAAAEEITQLAAEWGGQIDLAVDAVAADTFSKTADAAKTTLLRWQTTGYDNAQAAQTAMEEYLLAQKCELYEQLLTYQLAQQEKDLIAVIRANANISDSVKEYYIGRMQRIKIDFTAVLQATDWNQAKSAADSAYQKALDDKKKEFNTAMN